MSRVKTIEFQIEATRMVDEYFYPHMLVTWLSFVTKRETCCKILKYVKCLSI